MFQINTSNNCFITNSIYSCCRLVNQSVDRVLNKVKCDSHTCVGRTFNSLLHLSLTAITFVGTGLLAASIITGSVAVTFPLIVGGSIAVAGLALSALLFTKFLKSCRGENEFVRMDDNPELNLDDDFILYSYDMQTVFKNDHPCGYTFDPETQIIQFSFRSFEIVQRVARDIHHTGEEISVKVTKCEDTDNTYILHMSRRDFVKILTAGTETNNHPELAKNSDIDEPKMVNSTTLNVDSLEEFKIRIGKILPEDNGLTEIHKGRFAYICEFESDSKAEEALKIIDQHSGSETTRFGNAGGVPTLYVFTAAQST